MLIPNPSPATSCRFNRNSHSYKKREREHAVNVRLVYLENACLQDLNNVRLLNLKKARVLNLYNARLLKIHKDSTFLQGNIVRGIFFSTKTFHNVSTNFSAVSSPWCGPYWFRLLMLVAGPRSWLVGGPCILTNHIATGS